MICERGKCLICETAIAKPCPTCNSAWQNLDNYTTVELVWTHGSHMVTAVCIPCSQGPIKNADTKAMTQAIWDAWDKTGGVYDKSVTIKGVA